jgi:hypothetical protein
MINKNSPPKIASVICTLPIPKKGMRGNIVGLRKPAIKKIITNSP